MRIGLAAAPRARRTASTSRARRTGAPRADRAGRATAPRPDAPATSRCRTRAPAWPARSSLVGRTW